jgi:hypothetical protein
MKYLKYLVGDILTDGDEILYKNDLFGYYQTTNHKMIDSFYLAKIQKLIKYLQGIKNLKKF